YGGFDRSWKDEKSTPPNKKINVIKLSSLLNGPSSHKLVITMSASIPITTSAIDRFITLKIICF
ncbi:2701_t:CDS:1, partial [Racocetra persica]